MKIIIIACVIFFASCKNQAKNTAQGSNNPIDQIYGQWKLEKDLWKQYTKYTKVQIDSLKNTVLQISKDKIYFENISFIDVGTFSSSNIKISKLFDKENWEYSWFKDGDRFLLVPKLVGPLIYRYSKEELSKIIKIDLGCDGEPNLNTLYLKQDTLILTHIGGITLIMTKVP